MFVCKTGQCLPQAVFPAEGVGAMVGGLAWGRGGVEVAVLRPGQDRQVGWVPLGKRHPVHPPVLGSVGAVRQAGAPLPRAGPGAGY